VAELGLGFRVRGCLGRAPWLVGLEESLAAAAYRGWGLGRDAADCNWRGRAASSVKEWRSGKWLVRGAISGGLGGQQGQSGFIEPGVCMLSPQCLHVQVVVKCMIFSPGNWE
jgi:hypothetical protein